MTPREVDLEALDARVDQQAIVLRSQRLDADRLAETRLRPHDERAGVVGHLPGRDVVREAVGYLCDVAGAQWVAREVDVQVADGEVSERRGERQLRIHRVVDPDRRGRRLGVEPCPDDGSGAALLVHEVGPDVRAVGVERRVGRQQGRLGGLEPADEVRLVQGAAGRRRPPPLGPGGRGLDEPAAVEHRDVPAAPAGVDEPRRLVVRELQDVEELVCEVRGKIGNARPIDHDDAARDLPAAAVRGERRHRIGGGYGAAWDGEALAVAHPTLVRTEHVDVDQIVAAVGVRPRWPHGGRHRVPEIVGEPGYVAARALVRCRVCAGAEPDLEVATGRHDAAPMAGATRGDSCAAWPACRAGAAGGHGGPKGLRGSSGRSRYASTSSRAASGRTFAITRTSAKSNPSSPAGPEPSNASGSRGSWNSAQAR